MIRGAAIMLVVRVCSVCEDGGGAKLKNLVPIV